MPFNGWSFTPSPEDPELPGLLYCRVMSPVGTHVVDLAAIWALTGRDVPTYTEQFAAVLGFAATRESTMPLIIAGISTRRLKVPRSRYTLRILRQRANSVSYPVTTTSTRLPTVPSQP